METPQLSNHTDSKPSNLSCPFNNLTKVMLPHKVPGFGYLKWHTLIRFNSNPHNWFKVKHLYKDDCGTYWIQPKSVIAPYVRVNILALDNFITIDNCPYKYGTKDVQIRIPFELSDRY